jgi:tRNA 2-thiouridine synthesizing protein B
VSEPASSHSDLRAAARILIEDAVISAMEGASGKELIESLMAAGVKVYALSPDLEARGIENGRLMHGIETVDYDGFVGLVEKYEVVPWL